MTAPTDREAIVKLLHHALSLLPGPGAVPDTYTELRRVLHDALLAALTAQGGEQTADTQHDRDKDWILAMGHALGLNSGFNVPIAPEAEPFRKLFAEIRERQTADTVSVPREPTIDMLIALTGEWHPDHHSKMRERYKAMLAAKEGKS